MIYSAVNIKAAKCGSGVHEWDLPVQRLKGWAQVSIWYCLKFRI